MTNHDEHENDTMDEAFASQTLGGHDDRTTHGDAVQGEAAEPTLDPSDYDQADVEVSDTGKVASQPQTESGFANDTAATQALHDGPVLDPVDDADPETTGAG
ncbi:hypothetical protein [Salinibacterium sp. ZJ77]|uniref:hypothetical protein n=1 Tax=Salinibacterium sp. ZJ77 TaxID=2708337 RepID=UPI00142463C2|nr:hypothetical protein [Salinibacterium sp. ZJ77]